MQRGLDIYLFQCFKIRLFYVTSNQIKRNENIQFFFQNWKISKYCFVLPPIIFCIKFYQYIQTPICILTIIKIGSLPTQMSILLFEAVGVKTRSQARIYSRQRIQISLTATFGLPKTYTVYTDQEIGIKVKNLELNQRTIADNDEESSEEVIQENIRFRTKILQSYCRKRLAKITADMQNSHKYNLRPRKIRNTR